MEHETILTPEARRAILLKQRRQNKIIEFLFILAVIAYPITNFLIFYLYKNATSILMAFQQYDADYKLQWVGLENFKIFFKGFGEPGNLYLVGLRNNLIAFLISLFLFRPMQFALSFFIYKKAPLGSTYRFAMMIPSILSSTLVSLMFLRFVNAIPLWMKTLGYKDFPKLLYDRRTRLFMTFFYEFWNGFGMSVIYYYNAMNRIDHEIVESAQLDGITYWTEFFTITFPMIFPTVTTFLITGITGLIGSEGPLYLFWQLEAPTDVYRFGYITLQYTLVQGKPAYPLVAAIGLLSMIIMTPLTLMLKNWLERIDPTKA